MLKFIDNQKIEHVFNLENLVHVHVRKSDEKMSRSLCICLGHTPFQ